MDTQPDVGAACVDFVLSDLGDDLALYDPAEQPSICSNIPKTNSFPGRPPPILQSRIPAWDESVVPSSRPRSHPFHVSLPSSSASKKCLFRVEGEDRFLVVSRDFPFAVYFSFDGPPPARSEVWAVVKCKEESDVRTLGPVHKCIKHSQTGVKQFLVANNGSVTYGNWDSHQAVKVPCIAMPGFKELSYAVHQALEKSWAIVHDGRYTCVYECTCYSSCFVGRGPRLIIQFSLMSKQGSARDLSNQRNAPPGTGGVVVHPSWLSSSLPLCVWDVPTAFVVVVIIAARDSRPNSAPTAETSDGVVLGTDAIHLKSCSTPSKEGSKKSAKRPTGRAGGSDSGERKKILRIDMDPQRTSEGGALASNIAPPFDFIGEDQPDQDGYYSFSWKMKDPFIYNMLKVFRYSHHLS